MDNCAMTTEQQLQDKMLALCLLDKECPIIPYLEGNPEHRHELGCFCKGTGRVYLLDPDGKFRLRVKCSCPCHRLDGQRPVSMTAAQIYHKLDLPCDRCHGRGWTPTTDLWAYVKAAWPCIGPYRTTLPHTWQGRLLELVDSALDYQQDPGEAAFEVVAEALLKNDEMPLACPECGNLRPGDERVEAGMKCGFCAYL